MQVRSALLASLSVRSILWATGTGIVSVAIASGLVAVLQRGVGIPNASSVYILAAAFSGLLAGRIGAVVAAVAAFLAYDFLFVPPYFTFTVHDPAEWLTLVLLLVVGLLTGELAALLRGRAEAAQVREREARALFAVSRELATRASTVAALPRILTTLRAEAGLERSWIVSEPTRGAGRGRRLADTDPERPLPEPGRYLILRRTPGDAPARWDAIREPGRTSARGHVREAGPDEAAPGAAEPLAGAVVALKVAAVVGERPMASLWGTRLRANGAPDRSATRLLAAAADQVAQALEQDRLSAEAAEAEIVRRSDALKTSLLESVSHDLRTPLASIRAAAGSLMDRTVVLGDEDRWASAETIDREAERLNRLVTNLLDLSRIEAGALRADLEAYDLRAAVEETLGRVRHLLAERHIEVAIEDVPPVLVDAVFLEQVLVNLLENARRYSPADARVRICGRALDEERLVRLTVEDAGQGVPTEALPRLFEKFYRVPAARRPSRAGTGIGLTVVRGLVEAMGGRVNARASELGGLAVDIDLVVAPTQSDMPA